MYKELKENVKAKWTKTKAWCAEHKKALILGAIGVSAGAITVYVATRHGENGVDDVKLPTIPRGDADILDDWIKEFIGKVDGTDYGVRDYFLDEAASQLDINDQLSEPDKWGDAIWDAVTIANIFGKENIDGIIFLPDIDGNDSNGIAVFTKHSTEA